MSLPPASAKLVMQEVAELMRRPLDGIEVLPSDELSVVEARVRGPVDTPFEGGVFLVRLVLDGGYPTQPPKGFFATKIFHPNVSEPKGEICVNTLKRDWEASLGLRHVLLVVRCLLVEPNPESALNEEAGRLLLSEYTEYSRRAALYTQIHARPALKENAAGAADGTELLPAVAKKAAATPLAAKAPNKDRKRTLKRL